MLQKIVVIRLEEQLFGINIDQVQSIERINDITQIPQSGHFLEGIIHLRGDVIPIIDLKMKLNLGKTEITNDTKILIVNINDLPIGLLVDQATDVLDVDHSIIEDSRVLSNKSQLAIEAIIKLENELLLLLSLNDLVLDYEMETIKQLVEANTQ